MPITLQDPIFNNIRNKKNFSQRFIDQLNRSPTMVAWVAQYNQAIAAGTHEPIIDGEARYFRLGERGNDSNGNPTLGAWRVDFSQLTGGLNDPRAVGVWAHEVAHFIYINSPQGQADAARTSELIELGSTQALSTEQSAELYRLVRKNESVSDYGSDVVLDSVFGPTQLDPYYSRQAVRDIGDSNLDSLAFMSAVGDRMVDIELGIQAQGGALSGRSIYATEFINGALAKARASGVPLRSIEPGSDLAEDGSRSVNIVFADGTTQSLRIFSDLTSTETIRLPAGDLSIITRGAPIGGAILGEVLSTRIEIPQPDGGFNFVERDRSGNSTSVGSTRYFDDADGGQSSLSTTTYPNGRIVEQSTDSTGAPFSQRITQPVAHNTERIDDYRYVNGQAVPQSSRATQYFYDEAGVSRIEEVTTYASNGRPTTIRTAYDTDNQPGVSRDVTANSGLSNLTDQQTSAVFSDVAGLISAIRSGQPLPAAISGIRLVNTLDGLDGYQDIPNLGAVSRVGAGVLSFYNLYNAFRTGDTFSRVNATLSSINYANIAINGTVTAAGGITFAAGSTAGSVNTFLNGGSGSIGVLPALGLVASIKAGDPIGVAQSVGTLINPGFLTTPLGIFLIGVSILKSLFAKQPEAWGVANVTYGEGFDNLRLKVNASGETFGVDRVRDQLNNLIDSSVTLANGQQVRIGLQAQIDQLNTNLPADQRLGLIAQRMPGLSWRASDLDNQGYQLVDIDPLTGEQRYPFRRFDDDGIPFSSNEALYTVDLTDPEQRKRMDQALLDAAYRRGAIAPLWEVKTAKLQGDAGAVDAGLSEEERAAKAGYAAKLDTAYAAANPNSEEAKSKRVGRFMPVTLDLDGDGKISQTTIAEQNQSDTDNIEAVSFNWDGQGFKKQTSWVKANDGFLVLDRDFNQSVDNGAELLSNPLVADPAKGLRSLATWDANGDGKIDKLDPIYHQLKVWQDFNQDGDNANIVTLNTASGPQPSLVQDKATVTTAGQAGGPGRDLLELNSLADWGITAIDYNNGRYEYDSSLRTSDNGLALIKRYVSANGTGYASAQTLTLDASNQGIRYTPVGAGIKIDDSSGSSEIIITQIVSDSVTLPPVNQAPRLNSALTDLSVDEDNAISWQVPAGAFSDANTNDQINYILQLDNGQPLPEWLQFNPVSRQLTGTPGNAQVGSLALRFIRQYEFDSGLRSVYKGKPPKLLAKYHFYLAISTNDQFWRMQA
jgi:hypothetical protein